ncbi:MAG: hypothetical protein M1482_04940 [Chloroflexi bacterium]|nr:hypothetical protein [Chloroflexota bacterium]
MLPDHLQQQVFFLLRSATSTLDVKHAIEVADQALARAGTSPASARGFWQALLTEMDSSPALQRSPLAANQLIAHARRMILSRTVVPKA